MMIPAGWDSWNKIRVLSEKFDCKEFAGDGCVEFFAKSIPKPAHLATTVGCKA